MAFSGTGAGRFQMQRVINGTNGAQGPQGDDGAEGRSVYLYQQAVTQPTAPVTGTGFNTSTGVAQNAAPWTSVPPGTITAGNVLWIATGIIRLGSGAAIWVQVGAYTVAQATGGAGTPGVDGTPGPRFAEVTLYTNPAVAIAPANPFATITWATGAIAITTAGWSQTPPTQVATSNLSVYASIFVFIDTTGIALTTSATGGTPVQATNFDGLVTFTGGDFAIDGATITTIDGGNITTGSISGGTNPPLDASVPPATGENGARLDLADGNFVFGNPMNYILWDGTSLTVQGEIVNLNLANLSAQGGGPFTYSARGAPEFTQADLIDSLGNPLGAGAYIFVLVGGGGGGQGAVTGDTAIDLQFRQSCGGAGAGIAIFSFVWDGTTPLATGGFGQNGFRGNSGTSREADGSGGRNPTAGIAYSFEYNGVTMALAGGGGAFISDAAGNYTDPPGGTVTYTIPAGLTMLSQISRPGQGITVQTLSAGRPGAACDFFGDLDPIILGGTSQSGISAFGPYSGGEIGFELDDIIDTRSILGSSSGSVRGLGYIGGASFSSRTLSNFGTAVTGFDGGIFAGGGSGSRTGTSTFADAYARGGDGGFGGGGGGASAHVLSNETSTGGLGGNGALFWSKL